MNSKRKSKTTVKKEKKCDICGKVVSDARNLAAHRRIHEKSDQVKQIYVCFICNKSFPQKPKYDKHMADKHNLQRKQGGPSQGTKAFNDGVNIASTPGPSSVTSTNPRSTARTVIANPATNQVPSSSNASSGILAGQFAVPYPVPKRTDKRRVQFQTPPPKRQGNTEDLDDEDDDEVNLDRVVFVPNTPAESDDLSQMQNVEFSQDDDMPGDEDEEEERHEDDPDIFDNSQPNAKFPLKSCLRQPKLVLATGNEHETIQTQRQQQQDKENGDNDDLENSQMNVEDDGVVNLDLMTQDEIRNDNDDSEQQQQQRGSIMAGDEVILKTREKETKVDDNVPAGVTENEQRGAPVVTATVTHKSTTNINHPKTNPKTVEVTRIENSLIVQWMLVESAYDLSGVAGLDFFNDFLSGNLAMSSHVIYTQDVIKLLSLKPEENLGFIVPSFFLLEYVINVAKLKDLLELYNGMIKGRVEIHSSFKQLAKHLILQQLQQHVGELYDQPNNTSNSQFSNPSLPEIPEFFQSKLDIKPLILEMEMGIGLESMSSNKPNAKDMDWLKQVQRIMTKIILDDPAWDDITNQGQIDEGVRKQFCLSLLNSILESIKVGTFRNTYESMIFHNLDTTARNTKIFLHATNEMGFIWPLNLPTYNVVQHGISSTVSSDVATVKVSNSGSEVNVVTDLICRRKPKSSYIGLINYAVYEMAKQLGVSDVRKFLFGTNDVEDFGVPYLRKDILQICAKEKIVTLFNDVCSLASWIPSQDKYLILLRFNSAEVIWLLNQKQVPFMDEYEVYRAVITWAIYQERKDVVVKEDFLLYKTKKVEACFNRVFQECICLLDLKYQFEILLRDKYIGREWITAAFEQMRNPTRIPPSKCLRHRFPV